VEARAAADAAAAAAADDSAAASGAAAAQQQAAEAADTAGAAAAAGADSSDADEINEAAFTTHVDEAPADAADRGFDGVLPLAAGEGDRGAGTGAGSAAQAAAPVEDFDAMLRRVEREERRKARSQHSSPYVRWTGAVASGQLLPPTATATAAAAVSLGFAPSETLGAHPAASQVVLDGSLSGEALQQLLMPEFEASMGPYVRWVSRPTFKVPPPPAKQS
jgi:hypothetical protein